MKNDGSSPWQHKHVFGQDQQRPRARRTLMVVVLTATMMVVEIAAGLIYGSMALLADAWIDQPIARCLARRCRGGVFRAG